MTTTTHELEIVKEDYEVFFWQKVKDLISQGYRVDSTNIASVISKGDQGEYCTHIFTAILIKE